MSFFCFWKVAAFKAFSISQPGPAPAPPSASQPARPLVPQRSPALRLSPQALPRVSPAAPAFICIVHTHTFYCFTIGAAMGNILNPNSITLPSATVVGSILNPEQYCFAISAAMGSIRNPKQYCFAIIAAMGSIQNPKQYCFAISSITTHKVLTSGMHEASHWKCQCRILTARTSGAWQENVPTVEPTCREYDWPSSLNKGKWKSYWGLQPGFSCAFFVVWIVVTVSVTRQSPTNNYGLWYLWL